MPAWGDHVLDESPSPLPVAPIALSSCVRKGPESSQLDQGVQAVGHLGGGNSPDILLREGRHRVLSPPVPWALGGRAGRACVTSSESHTTQNGRQWGPAFLSMVGDAGPVGVGTHPGEPCHLAPFPLCSAVMQSRF